MPRIFRLSRHVFLPGSFLAGWCGILVKSVRSSGQTGFRVRRTGLTLLEVMVALVILGLVATGFLETFAGALRATAGTRTWAQALVYAGEGQEAVKIEGVARATGTDLPLGGGFHRHIALRPWREGVFRATVTVTLPDGVVFELDRLMLTP